MPRQPNKVQTVTITVSTTPGVHERLEALVESGLYGKNAAEAAERLIARGLESLMEQGKLLRHDSTSSN